MKEKIMYLIIGVLIGAIVTTSGLLIYSKINKSTKSNERNMPNMGEPQARPDGDNSEMGEPPSMDNSDSSNMSEPPARPDGDSSNMSEPPSKPDGSKSQALSGNNQSKSSSSETSNS